MDLFIVDVIFWLSIFKTGKEIHEIYNLSRLLS